MECKLYSDTEPHALLLQLRRPDFRTPTKLSLTWLSFTGVSYLCRYSGGAESVTPGLQPQHCSAHTCADESR